tara:strand:- start:14 stop:166 length:153 start_codon:yes stop_codon:yes gene_type:complete
MWFKDKFKNDANKIKLNNIIELKLIFSIKVKLFILDDPLSITKMLNVNKK